PGPFPAHHVAQFVPYDFDDLMPGRQALEHFLSDGLLADAFDEVLDYLEVHIGLKERQPNFFERLGNILLRKHTVPTELLEDLFKFAAERVEHGTTKKQAIEALHQISDRLVISRK